MKKNLFLLPLAAAMMLTACSENEPAANGGGNGVATDGARFLAINIVSNGTAGSRVDGTGTQYDGENDSHFEDGVEDGTASENEVKGIRFYFFNASGDALDIKTNTEGKKVNYYDVPAEEISVNNTPIKDNPEQENSTTHKDEFHNMTVEKILNAVIIINKNEPLPAMVVAVINPNKDGANYSLGTQSLTLPLLREKYDNYALKANKGEFVMANSVYAEGGITPIYSTPISAANYEKDLDAAKANPVEIYVERNVAKVRLSAKGINSDETASGSHLYKVYKKGTEDQLTIETGDGQVKNIYVKFLGWDVTGDVSYANLIKKIRPWASDKLGASLVWNRPNYHRSYWADFCNPTGGVTVENQYFPYDDGDGEKKHFVKAKFDGTEAIYCNENAERDPNGEVDDYTSVIIKATICDAKGNALPISEYGGNRFVEDKDFSGLKRRYIAMWLGDRRALPVRWGDVKVENEDGTTTTKKGWVAMSSEDLTFIPAEKINPAFIDDSNNSNSNEDATKASADKNGRYYVYACLNDKAAKEYEWHTNTTENIESSGTLIKADDINDMLADLSRAKVWNGGMTYYFADIQHLGTNIFGVVRNHIYDLNLTKIYGIGTPVYDPNLPVIPEKPTPDDTFIAARVNILSWRLVTNNITLDWD